MPTDTENTAPAVDTNTPAAPETPAAPAEWDGDFGKLDSQEWWKTVPESARGHITKLHQDATAATERASYLDRLFNSDDTVAALRADLATKDQELATLKASLGETTKVRDELQTQHAELSARMAEIAADREFDRLEAKYPDIFKDVYYTDEKQTELVQDKGAYVTFLDLMSKGVPEEKAARLARAELPAGDSGGPLAAPATPAASARPAERPVTVPKSVAAATPGGNTPSRTVKYNAQMDLDEAMAQARREAAIEDGLVTG